MRYILAICPNDQLNQMGYTRIEIDGNHHVFTRIFNLESPGAHQAYEELKAQHREKLKDHLITSPKLPFEASALLPGEYIGDDGKIHYDSDEFDPAVLSF